MTRAKGVKAGFSCSDGCFGSGVQVLVEERSHVRAGFRVVAERRCDEEQPEFDGFFVAGLAYQLQLSKRRIDFGGLFQERLAEGREFDALMAAIEQVLSEFGFEVCHRLRHCLHGNAVLASGRGQAAAIRDADEVLDLFDVQ